MSSANRDIFTVSLPICIPFIPSSCLTALARSSSTSMLSRSGDSGYPCLVPDFRGNGFSFSLLSIMLAVEPFQYQYYLDTLVSYRRAHQTFLVKGQRTDIIDLKGHIISASTIQLSIVD
jgi:hypothetical protein